MAEARAKPGELSFGSAGNGTAVHMAGEQFRQAAGFTYLHVPYRGGGPMITDLLAGRVQMAFGTVPAIARACARGPAARAGRHRRWRGRALLPEVPSMAEAGLPQVDAALINALVGPAGLPDDGRGAAVRRRRAPSVDRRRRSAQRLAELGFDPVGSTPQEVRDAFAAEIPRWEAIVRQGGITPD